MIKKIITICGLVLALTATMALSAGATMITGDISFAGKTTFDPPFTQFKSFSQVEVTDGDGDYATIPTGNPTSPGVMFTPFVFNPPVLSITPLWSFSYSGKDYSFDATSVIVTYDDGNNVLIKGAGIAHIGGLDDTPMSWSISANRAGKTASFSSSASAVPEPATWLLLGSGLIGLAGFARKKFHRA